MHLSTIAILSRPASELYYEIDVTPYPDRLSDLFQLEFFGMKLGLENITKLLEFLGRPDRKFPAIHVAGTNGKGSVCAMLAAVHQAAGRKTGLYTSPHLVDFRERIRIDGEMISEEEVSQFLERIWPKVKELRATFFEVTTALAFDHFARHRVEIAIIETGLGGRLDATNVLEHPLATVITSIGYDHTAQLGSTLEAIAFEKSGIFKPYVPAIVNCEEPLEPLFRGRAREAGAPLLFVRQAIRRSNEKGRTLWTPPFPGVHQERNVHTVRATIEMLPYRIPLKLTRKGIHSTELLTCFHGRIEPIFHPDLAKRKVDFFVDVGHNPQAFDAVGKFFASRKGKRKPIVVAGVMKDKDVDGILASIKKFASSFIAVQAKTDRALSSATLHAAAGRAGIASLNGGAVLDGLAQAFQRAQRGNTVLLTGSHYVVGEFLENFQQGGRVFMV